MEVDEREIGALGGDQDIVEITPTEKRAELVCQARIEPDSVGG